MKALTSIRDRVNSSLSTQLLLIIVPTTFILVGMGAWLVHEFVVNQIARMTEAQMISKVNTIEDVLQHEFITNNQEMLQQMVFDIGVQQQAEVVRLLSRENIVLASSIPDEIGIRLNRQDPRCQACHTSDPGQKPVTRVQSFSNDQSNVVLVADQIENRIACQGCHIEDVPNLGVILVEIPAGTLENRHLLDMWMIIGTLLISVLISGVAFIFISTKVTKPLRIPSKSWIDENMIAGEDEVKSVSRRLKTIEGSLQIREKELADQHRKIDTIFSLQYDIDNPPSIEKFFRQALSIVQEVTGYRTITMRLYEERTDSFRLMVQMGMSPRMLKELESIPASAGFHVEVVQTHQSVYTSDMSSDPRMTSDAPIREGYRSLICIPLLAQDKLVGSMQIALKEEHTWKEDEVRWLTLIGRRIGMLIYQIQLAERLRNLAVLEERSRISQEIHDGIAQLIGSLRLWSDDALISFEERDFDAAQKRVRKIEAAASDAYASLRDEMLGLRDTVSPRKDLLAVLTEYLIRFQRQWGIRTELHLEGTAQQLRTLPITPTAEIQLLRILQEGLTNVRRHSNASNVKVTISNNEGWLKVLIQDNGVGFNPENINEDRLGLRIMRERAASAGGTISISSIVDVGTEIEIQIPLQNSHNIQAGER
jgi:two-component system, NarL family, nitrate/nitrite sensor histidine kinase NarX